MRCASHPRDSRVSNRHTGRRQLVFAARHIPRVQPRLRSLTSWFCKERLNCSDRQLVIADLTRLGSAHRGVFPKENTGAPTRLALTSFVTKLALRKVWSTLGSIEPVEVFERTHPAKGTHPERPDAFCGQQTGRSGMTVLALSNPGFAPLRALVLGNAFSTVAGYGV